MFARRRLLLGLTAIIVGCATWAAWRAFTVPPRFGEEEIAKIRLGMTREEVVQILGCPPGGYDGYVGDYDVAGQIARHEAPLQMPQKNGETWACRGAAVEVCFCLGKVSRIQRPTATTQEFWLRRLWRRIARM